MVNCPTMDTGNIHNLRKHYLLKRTFIQHILAPAKKNSGEKLGQGMKNHSSKNKSS
jgi:hypothetical protein